MSTRMFRRLSVFAVLGLFSLIHVPAAWAGGGGTPMPWNGPLQNLLDNLTGPTATTVGMLAFVAGAMTLVLSKDNRYVQVFGGVIVMTSVIIGVVQLFNALQFGGAVL